MGSPRKKLSRRVRYTPEDFMTSDGWNFYILDDTPLLPSLAAAEAEWERLRTDTWRLWAEWGPTSIYPPEAAARLDGISDVDGFRARRPAAAAAIEVELDQYVANCRKWLDEENARYLTFDNPPPPLVPWFTAS